MSVLSNGTPLNRQDISDIIAGLHAAAFTDRAGAEIYDRLAENSPSNQAARAELAAEYRRTADRREALANTISSMAARLCLVTWDEEADTTQRHARAHATAQAYLADKSNAIDLEVTGEDAFRAWAESCKFDSAAWFSLLLICREISYPPANHEGAE